MKSKEITICNRPVTLAYCYATEISYKLLANEDISELMKEVETCMKAEQPYMPDIKKTIFLILAAASAYYDSKGEELPIDDKTLMYECSPEEMGTSLGVVLGLRQMFYQVSADEPKETKGNGKGKKKN